MSGGVDSSVAAALLKEQGWEVAGITLRLWEEASNGLSGKTTRSCCAWEAVFDARQAARQLGINHYVINLKERFYDDVVVYFVEEYRAGRTPNPCIVCNRDIKFTALFNKLSEMKATHLATGHYARVEYDAVKDCYLLKKGLDIHKDQSYMLYNLNQEQLARTLFPLGGLTKEQVRLKAESMGLRVAGKAESQEICFVPDDDYRAFLVRSGVKSVPGPIIDTKNNFLGNHRGLPFYTVGQRRGLGLAAPIPLYVIELRTSDNTLVVGERHELFCSGLEVEGLNLIASNKLQEDQEIKVKIRYRSPAVPALLKTLEREDEARVIFKKSQAAVTPGQAAVFYRDDLVLGGGIIKKSLADTPEA